MNSTRPLVGASSAIAMRASVDLPEARRAKVLPFNMSEQPSASINCGYTRSGLPIGLQVTGPRHDDLGVLQVCHAWEQLRPAQRPWPQPPAG